MTVEQQRCEAAGCTGKHPGGFAIDEKPMTNTYSFCHHCHVTIYQQASDPAWYLAGVPAASTGCIDSPTGFHEPPTAIGATRTCPDCGRPQHYTGTEYGWAHDALVDTWHCADPRKPQRCLNCGAREDEPCLDWCAYKPNGRAMA